MWEGMGVTVKINKENIENIINLTDTQQGILFHYLNNKNSCLYQVQLSITLCGVVKTNLIKSAWDHVVCSNEILRGVFRWGTIKKPIQVILKDYEIPFEYFDLAEYEDHEKEERFQAIYDKKKQEAIDISKESIRIILCNFTPNMTKIILKNHHILFDGWSTSIIIKEFLDAYNCYLRGQEPQRKDKPPFWQVIKNRERVKKEDQKYFWSEYLNGLALQYSSSSNKEDPSSLIDSYEFQLEYKLASMIESFSKRMRTSVATILYAAWGILQSNYEDTEDIIFGTPVSGRSQGVQRIEEVVGLFINTIPFRFRVNPQLKVSDYIVEVGRNLNSREKFHHSPLVEIMEYGQISSREKIFHTLITIENYPLGKVRYKDSRSTITEFIVDEKTDYDLSVQFSFFNGISVKCGYNQEIYKAIFIAQMFKNFEYILWQLVNETRQDQTINQVEVVEPKERDLLLSDFNDTSAAYPNDDTIHEIFERQVKRTPGRIAVKLDDDCLTYRELNEKANVLAEMLQERGVGSNSFVGIMVEPSLDMIVAILGVLKSGGVYVPIDSIYPDERVQFMIEDSQCEILIAQKILSDRISFLGQILFIDEINFLKHSKINLVNISTSNDAAYVIYTSGTTGMPKGTVIEHRNVVRLFFNDKMPFTFNQNDIWLMFHSYCFDFSVWEMYGALLFGGKLILAPRETVLSMNKLSNLLVDEKVTVLNQVPTSFFKFSKRIFEKDHVSFSLRYIIFGGENLKIYRLEKWYKRFPQIEFINMYGMTEATVHTTFKRIEIDDIKSPISNIGKPLPTSKVYILDKNLKIQPIGVFGEIYVSGEGVARGYLNRRNLTNERFVDNPYELGKKMYRSGDIGRWLQNGEVEYIGRVDQQVKIRGFRIEPGEIENKILKCEGVKDVVVIVNNNEVGDNHLSAYIVSNLEIERKRIREDLARSLAEYMIPSYFIQVDELPLTHNGKIDKDALCKVNLPIHDKNKIKISKDSLEEKVGHIWESVLNIEEIGSSQSFFELGGHSLLMVEAIWRIQREFNIEIPIKYFFSNPTISDICAYIKNNRQQKYADIEIAETKEYYEASSSQKRIYLQQQINPNDLSYNMPCMLEAEGKFDFNKFKQAVKQLIQTHESLRTRFLNNDGLIVQKIEDTTSPFIQLFDKDFISTIYPVQGFPIQEEEFIDKLQEWFVRPFDLSQLPLLRVLVMKDSEYKHYLLFDMHHIISDGMSIKVLIQDLTDLYKGSGVKKLLIQYKDYSEWQSVFLKSNKLVKDKAYWVNQFKNGIPLLDIPLDHNRPKVRNFKGEHVHMEIPKVLKIRLDRLSSENECTLFMVLFAALNLLLSRYSRQDDIVIGTPTMGRAHPDTERIIGSFINILPIKVKHNSSKRFSEFLEEVKMQVVSDFEHQEYPYELLVEQLDYERIFNRNPLFDILFIMQNLFDDTIIMENLKLKHSPFLKNTSKYDISVLATETKNKLRIEMEYSTQLFEKATVEKILQNYIRVLEIVAEKPHIPMKEICILPWSEINTLLYEFNKPNSEPYQIKPESIENNLIHKLFEIQVEKHPRKTAIVFENRQMNYSELNQKANLLALHVKARGAKVGDLIVIYTDRSFEMLIAVIAVLKAGCAYLPIDPKYPNYRTQFMIEDSRAKMILTQQKYLTRLSSFEIETIDIGVNFITDKEIMNLQNNQNENSLAYVIYTSGSTGTPKGVCIEHKSVCNFIRGVCQTINFDTSSCILSFTTICFDIFFLETILPLTQGSKVVIANEREVYSTEEILGIITHHGVNMLQATPSRVRMLLKEPESTKLFHQIKILMIGGEMFSVKLLNELRKFSLSRIYNMYGPTETTIWSSIKDLSYTDHITIGKPILNTQFYIVDREYCLQPIGVPGELCIAGEGLAKGYLDRETLTNERFVDNPFETRSKMYRTGDLAKWNTKGEVELIGRIDQQVKIRGYRVELEEIEAVINEFSENIEGIVAVHGDCEEGYLCAYLVYNNEINVDKLREFLIDRLPDNMVPSMFVRLKQFPHTLNGKIDRKKMLVSNSITRIEKAYVAPRDQLEEEIVRIWQEVLAKDIGIDHSFFYLGGHSLNALTLLSKINEEIGVTISLKDFFLNPTIREIAKLIRNGERGEVLIQPSGTRDYYPLSSAQKRMYIVNEFNKNEIVYNMPMLALLKGRLDEEKFEFAFKEMVCRHEILRTSFVYHEGQFMQKISEELQIEIEYVNSFQEEVEEIVKNSVIPFQLDKIPLFRIKIIQINKEKRYLFLDMHHIISDGISVSIILSEFLKLYNDERLPDLKLQYKDYAVWQQNTKETKRIDEQRQYWLDKLQPPPKFPRLPIDFNEDFVDHTIGSVKKEIINSVIVDKVRQFSWMHNTTVHNVLLSVYSALISRISSLDDVVIGVIVSGRNHAFLQSIVGMFVNILPIRSYPSLDKTFSELLSEIKLLMADALDHQEYQYEDLIQDFGLQEGGMRNPLFNTTFLFMSSFQTKEEVQELQIIPCSIKTNHAQYDLQLIIVEGEKDIEINIEYGSELFASSTIDMIIQNYINILMSVIENPHWKLKELEIRKKSGC